MPAGNPSFLFDRMLGRLCRKMRLLGFDAKLNAPEEGGRFLLNAADEGRVPVTMTKRAKDRPGPPAVVLESSGTVDQIAELLRYIGESPSLKPFTRCLECNEELDEENASSARKEVPPYVAESFRCFSRCPRCRRLYWKGTHYQAMAGEIELIKARLEKGRR